MPKTGMVCMNTLELHEYDLLAIDNVYACRGYCVNAATGKVIDYFEFSALVGHIFYTGKVLLAEYYVYRLFVQYHVNCAIEFVECHFACKSYMDFSIIRSSPLHVFISVSYGNILVCREILYTILFCNCYVSQRNVTNRCWVGRVFENEIPERQFVCPVCRSNDLDGRCLRIDDRAIYRYNQDIGIAVCLRHSK